MIEASVVIEDSSGKMLRVAVFSPPSLQHVVQSGVQEAVVVAAKVASVTEAWRLASVRALVASVREAWRLASAQLLVLWEVAVEQTVSSAVSSACRLSSQRPGPVCWSVRCRGVV